MRLCRTFRRAFLARKNLFFSPFPVRVADYLLAANIMIINIKRRIIASAVMLMPGRTSSLDFSVTV